MCQQARKDSGTATRSDVVETRWDDPLTVRREMTMQFFNDSDIDINGISERLGYIVGREVLDGIDVVDGVAKAHDNADFMRELTNLVEERIARQVARDIVAKRQHVVDGDARVLARITCQRVNFRDDCEYDHEEIVDATDALGLMDAEDAIAIILGHDYCDDNGIDYYAADDDLFERCESLGLVEWDGPFDVDVCGSDTRIDGIKSRPNEYLHARFPERDFSDYE